MYKIIRFIDDAVDRMLALAMILVLLIGFYFIYDTAYVYYYASAGRVSFLRHNKETSVETVRRPVSKDYVGWLYLDDTNVDYPVMQGEDNSKYLNTDPYGNYSLAGSIFLDSRCSPDFSDSYSVLYGHHMSNHLMFGALDRFYDESYFNQHTTGTLTVGKKVYTLQVFAMLVTEASDRVIFEPNGSESVLKLAKESSMYYRQPMSDHILALTTCVDASNYTRTVVLCAMLEPRIGEVE